MRHGEFEFARPRAVDLGSTRWFRLLVGGIWSLVGLLVAVGVYSVIDTLSAGLTIPAYLLTGWLFGSVLIVIVYAFSVRWHRFVDAPVNR